jgi:outer membrane protein OmpA-like peptidoglycan-associated protein
MRQFHFMLTAGLLVAGCAHSPKPAPSAITPAQPPAVTPASRTVAAEMLATEQQWLASWFKGTPVAVAQSGDGSLTVAVPRDYCFDAGASRVKPPLGAVLDKVAESLRRRPGAQLVQVAAPDDRKPATPLALARAEQVRRHLLGRGVAPQQLAQAPAQAATEGGVFLRMAALP